MGGIMFDHPSKPEFREARKLFTNTKKFIITATHGWKNALDGENPAHHAVSPQAFREFEDIRDRIVSANNEAATHGIKGIDLSAMPYVLRKLRLQVPMSAVVIGGDE